MEKVTGSNPVLPTISYKAEAMLRLFLFFKLPEGVLVLLEIGFWECGVA